MADYKHRAGSKKKRPTSCSHGLFFFGGLVAGLFLAGLAWLQLGQQLRSHEIPGIATKPQQSREPQQTAPKPNFEFYTILPEMEVVIPDEEIVTPEPTATPRRPSSSENREASRERSNGGYILQMGSFRKHQDADRLKARLALIGIEAEIQRVSINNRDTYHRVRSGPYRSQSQLNSARKLAKQNGITSLVIKLKE
ncbi:MAG: SPOR domain-containing protein [Candidatus Thiodiazotropha lotti]|uniref:SPOR domain-containing protein n=1 Tax=Candidatus Thiodiazotropha lotti TaxID=2792787 RepID=A0A9E4N265_9GAMM|nr:SPOR domain-containing protein [Candidatus Thiodiazotropha lotti]ODB98769.1 cell division protein [Candidatus Thiodiazotropha endoloripes]MCG7919934.1 SPOR domain-containing protein [Candidatus Thiodiazotropha lotti]MCG7932553.1 SPOR domain-containing protein [Candidatus Thiodiazotropha lotti]MCG7940520.1 SPOR domain-containing protein [Candidatus Thiodiazotropha lotti]